MVVRNKKGPNQFFQLCNVEAPTLIKNGVLIDLKQATHSARLKVGFLDRAILEVNFLFGFNLSHMALAVLYESGTLEIAVRLTQRAYRTKPFHKPKMVLEGDGCKWEVVVGQQTLQGSFPFFAYFYNKVWCLSDKMPLLTVPPNSAVSCIVQTKYALLI